MWSSLFSAWAKSKSICSHPLHLSRSVLRVFFWLSGAALRWLPTLNQLVIHDMAAGLSLGVLHYFKKSGRCPDVRVFLPDLPSDVDSALQSRWELRSIWGACHVNRKQAAAGMSKHISENERAWSHVTQIYFPGRDTSIDCGGNARGRHARGSGVGHDFHGNVFTFFSMMIHSASGKCRTRSHRRSAALVLADVVDTILAVPAVAERYHALSLPIGGGNTLDCSMRASNIDTRPWWHHMTNVWNLPLDKMFDQELRENKPLLTSRELPTEGGLLGTLLVTQAVSHETFWQQLSRFMVHQLFNILLQNMKAVLTCDQTVVTEPTPQRTLDKKDRHIIVGCFDSWMCVSMWCRHVSV